jgi:hypothetical protein
VWNHTQHFYVKMGSCELFSTGQPGTLTRNWDDSHASWCPANGCDGDGDIDIFENILPPLIPNWLQTGILLISASQAPRIATL